MRVKDIRILLNQTKIKLLEQLAKHGDEIGWMPPILTWSNLKFGLNYIFEDLNCIILCWTEQICIGLRIL